MSGMPEDILAKAQALCIDVERAGLADDIDGLEGEMHINSIGLQMVAAALLAEREEATRRERERCAALTDGFWQKADGFEAPMVSDIASAIRTPSEREAVRKAIREGKDG